MCWCWCWARTKALSLTLLLCWRTVSVSTSSQTTFCFLFRLCLCEEWTRIWSFDFIFLWTVISVSVQKLIPNYSDPVVKLYFKDVSPCGSQPGSLEAVWCHRPIIVACSSSVTFKFLFNYLRREKNVTGRIFTEGIQCCVYLHTNWIYQYGLDQDQIPVLDQIHGPSLLQIVSQYYLLPLYLIKGRKRYSWSRQPWTSHTKTIQMDT